MLSTVVSEKVKSGWLGDDHTTSGRHSAPETLLGGHPSFEGDVYAFACVAMGRDYILSQICLLTLSSFPEILTDQAPYSEISSELTVLAAKLHGKPPYDLNNFAIRRSLSTVPDALCQLLPACWNEDPLERPTMREICLRLPKFHP
jgi:hypothetical protein